MKGEVQRAVDHVALTNLFALGADSRASAQVKAITRQKLREKFSKEITLEPSQTYLTSNEEIFFNKMMSVLEDNISNSGFSVSEMVKEMTTSRPVLYRKVKALTGLTLVEFLMQFRLKKAALLLQQDKRTISEIAYMVGFNDPKYFSKCFKKLLCYS